VRRREARETSRHFIFSRGVRVLQVRYVVVRAMMSSTMLQGKSALARCTELWVHRNKQKEGAGILYTILGHALVYIGPKFGTVAQIRANEHFRMLTAFDGCGLAPSNIKSGSNARQPETGPINLEGGI
jgi:hypothetical protein